MDKEITTFSDIYGEKHKFHQHKNPMYDVNIDRIIVSNKVLFGKKSFKYFIG